MSRISTVLLLFAALLFTACGDDSSGDGSKSSPVASYELTPDGPECSDGAQVARFTVGDCPVVSCTWMCAEYEAQGPFDVDLKFQSCSDEPWEMLSELTIDSQPGTCAVYNN